MIYVFSDEVDCGEHLFKDQAPVEWTGWSGPSENAGAVGDIVLNYCSILYKKDMRVLELIHLV